MSHAQTVILLNLCLLYDLVMCCFLHPFVMQIRMSAAVNNNQHFMQNWLRQALCSVIFMDYFIESSQQLYEVGTIIFLLCNEKTKVYEFPVAAVTNYHKPGGLKQIKCIFSQFWRPDVQNRGVGWAMLPLKALREILFLASSSFWWMLSLFGFWLLTPISHMAFSCSLSVSSPCLSYDNTYHWI